MARVLIPFAEPDGAMRAVDALLREPRDAGLIVHLAAVVESLRPGKVAMFVSARARRSAGPRSGAAAGSRRCEARLAAAGVAHVAEIVLGSPRATIRALAQRADIDRVMLPPGEARLARRAARIRDLSPHPVTLVA